MGIKEDIADITAAVEANTKVIDSAELAFKRLADEIAALEPNRAAIAALAAQIRKDSGELAAAVVASTPAENPPTEPPVEGTIRVRTNDGRGDIRIKETEFNPAVHTRLGK